ncbi:MAG: hypothetical protein WA021_00805 [Minisyncoccia bacterium]
MPKKNYQPGDIIDLDDVAISSAALAAWHGVAQRAAAFCHQVGVRSEDLPEEQGRLEQDGSFSVFVKVKTPSGGEVDFSLPIPPGQWAWR